MLAQQDPALTEEWNTLKVLSPIKKWANKIPVNPGELT